MKITLIIKKSVKRYDTESKATIYARLRDGRQVDMVAPTRLTINPNLWDNKAEQVKSKIVCNDEMRSYYNDEARKLKSYLEKAYQSRQTAEPQKEWLKEALEQYYNPQKYNVETATEETAKPTLIALFDEFLEKHRLSDVRKKNYRVIKRGLQRYELYIRTTKRGQKAFVLDIDQVTADTLRNIWDFWKMNTATALFTRKSTKLYPKHARRNPEERIRYWIVSRASELSSTGATATKRPVTDRSTISRWRNAHTERLIISRSRSCTRFTARI